MCVGYADVATAGGLGGAAFAKAFQKIVTKRTREDEDGPILAKSKKLAKREEEEALAKAEKQEAKQKKLEMKKRGHELPTKKGANPERDVFEKQLLRTATKGVVRLFNAISKAQRTTSESDGKVSLVFFLALLCLSFRANR